MDAPTFDRLARRLAAATSRRRMLALAAAIGGAWAAGGRAVRAQQVAPGATAVQSLPEMVGPFDGIGPCDEYLLAGGPFPTDPIHIDDDLSLFLNQAPIFEDADGTVNVLAPIPFLAVPGDTLTVVARDRGGCRKISPLWLHCPSTDRTKILFSGRDDGCDPNRPAPAIFYEASFMI